MQHHFIAWEYPRNITLMYKVMTEIKIVPVNPASYQLAGLFTLSLRLVAGWTYFSAFWRRLVLENKLDPGTAGYIGEKFNHFLPNALGIKPMIEHLVTHPDQLWWAMAIFTIVEGVVGLLFMLGLFTRIMSIGVFGLAMGILLGAGWLGTTCLDEWQIGILGLAAGFTVFLSGSGKYSLDHWLYSTYTFTRSRWFSWLGSGTLPVETKPLHRWVLAGSAIILFITLFTNQVFHGGVWGTLHNKSARPKIEISDAAIVGNELKFTIYRVEGADVYGSFLIGISLTNQNHEVVFAKDGTDLSGMKNENISNAYVSKVKAGKHSLVVPLGSKAGLTLSEPSLGNLGEGVYQLTLTDISGIMWAETIHIK